MLWNMSQRDFCFSGMQMGKAEYTQYTHRYLNHTLSANLIPDYIEKIIIYPKYNHIKVKDDLHVAVIYMFAR